MVRGPSVPRTQVYDRSCVLVGQIESILRGRIGKRLLRCGLLSELIPVRFEYTLNSSFLRKQESSPQLLDSGLRRSDDERPTIVFLYGRITTNWY